MSFTYFKSVLFCLKKVNKPKYYKLVLSLMTRKSNDVISHNLLYFIHTQLHLFRKSLKSICTLYYELLFNINIFFLTINIYTIWTWISLIAFVILAREEIEYSLIYLYWGIHPSLIWDLTKTKPIKARRQSAMSMRPCHLTCSNNYRRCHMSSIGARAVQCKLRNTIYILTILHR